MKNNITTLLFLFFSVFSVNSYAQLYFKNSTKEPVKITYAKWNDSKHEDHWYTRGWFSAEPGETIQLCSGIGFQEYVYYYAETVDKTKNYDGDTRLLVERGGKSGFHIKNADKSYKKKSSENYKWEKFRKFYYKKGILGLAKVKQYINLKY